MFTPQLPRRFARGLAVSGAALLLANASLAQMTTRVSLDSMGSEAMGASTDSRVSEDGRFVVFSTVAQLVPADTNSHSDVYRYDRNTGVVDLVSRDTAGNAGNAASRHPAVTNDGQYVVFETLATNFADLGVPDNNQVSDICVRQYGVNPGVHYVTLDFAPLASGLPAVLANGASRFPDISAETYFDVTVMKQVHVIVFESDASNLGYDFSGNYVDTNGLTDIYRSVEGLFGWDGPASVLPRHEMVSWNLANLPIIQLGDNNSGGQGVPSCSVSVDGSYVAFTTSASNLLAGATDTNGVSDILLYDSGVQMPVARINVDHVTGGQAIGGPSTYPAISADGTQVAFQSTATNLVPGGSSTQHVYAHDLTTGETIRASQSTLGAAGNDVSQRPDISADGAFVAFDSVATNLVSDDTNNVDDVFVHSVAIQSTMRASLSETNAQADFASTDVCLTGTGGEMVFSSLATNLVPSDQNGAGDLNGSSDVFYRGCDPQAVVYCTSQTNSEGCVPTIGFNGSASSSLSDGFQITTRNVLNQTVGLYIIGTGALGATEVFPPIGTGFLCVGSPFTRGPGISTGGSPSGVDCTGVAEFEVNSITQGVILHDPGLPNDPNIYQPGTTVRVQFWSRDPGNMHPQFPTMNFSDAVIYTICH